LADPNPSWTSSLNWFGKTWGADQGAICPDAPQAPFTAKGGAGWLLQGSVNSAWSCSSLEFILGPGTSSVATNRAGSYTGNDWVTHWAADPMGREAYINYPDYFWLKETQILHPAKTPAFADGVDFFDCWPLETDLPASNLNTGAEVYLFYEVFSGWGMSTVTIPRHGSRPSSLSTNYPAAAKLPGSINISFYDGHAALVPLETLWQQEWHQGWQTPNPRPGL
jgi:prepilin-type processing-associated H-X9-DG protein